MRRTALRDHTHGGAGRGGAGGGAVSGVQAQVAPGGAGSANEHMHVSGVAQLTLNPVSPASGNHGAAAHTSPGSAASWSSKNSAASTRSTPTPPSEKRPSPGQPASARPSRRQFHERNESGIPPGSQSTRARMAPAVGTISEGVPWSSHRAASESADAGSPPQLEAVDSPPQDLDHTGVPTLPPDKLYHFFVCHHQASGGDQSNILRMRLEALGYKVWYDNGQSALHRNLEGMRSGVRESMCLMIFLSGRKETDGVADVNGQYQGPFTREFCHEEMTTAHEKGLRCIGVMETDDRKGKPDFNMEKSRALTGGPGGGPVHPKAKHNVHLLDDVTFIPFRRQQHEVEPMLREIQRQAAEAKFLSPHEQEAKSPAPQQQQQQQQRVVIQEVRASLSDEQRQELQQLEYEQQLKQQQQRLKSRGTCTWCCGSQPAD